MHLIKICTGCSCSQNFGHDNVKRAEQVLGIKVGETSKDGQFRLEKTGCLSHCENAPNVFFGKKTNDSLGTVDIDGKVINNLLPHRLEKELNQLKHDS